MNDKKLQWVAGFLIAGLVLLGLSASLIEHKSPPSDSHRLARVIHDSGHVHLLHPDLSRKENIDFSAPVFRLDSVETDETGDAFLEFEDGSRLRLLPNALVTLTEENEDGQNRIIVILKRGDLKVERATASAPWIAKNGERRAAKDYNDSDLQKAPTSEALANTTPETPLQAKAALNAQDISGVMNNYRPHFFKCYTQLLQKDPNAKGDVSLSFTVENSGKISASDVVSSTIQNEEFKKCLLEVLRRIDFHRFSGPPVSTLFPLKFE
jgi:hypothetical protein